MISLHQAEFEFVIYDNFSTSNKSDLTSIERIIGRKLDESGKWRYKEQTSTKKTFRLFYADAVIHLAGFKSVDESFIRSNEYYENNFFMELFELINAMDDCKINKIIFSSSATVWISKKITSRGSPRYKSSKSIWYDKTKYRTGFKI